MNESGNRVEDLAAWPTRGSPGLVYDIYVESACHGGTVLDGKTTNMTRSDSCPGSGQALFWHYRRSAHAARTLIGPRISVSFDTVAEDQRDRYTLGCDQYVSGRASLSAARLGDSKTTARARRRGVYRYE